MPILVTSMCHILFRFVHNPMLPEVGQIPAQVAARHVEQRPDDASPPGTNPREAGESGASNQLEEKGFRLIVLRVADRDAVGAEGIGSLLQKVVSDPAGCIFD